MQYFVISDIHGYYQQMVDALEGAGYHYANPDQHLIILGDMFDRGKLPWHVFQFIKPLVDQGLATLILGNHELALAELCERHYALKHDDSNGTTKTISLLSNHDRSASPFYSADGNFMLFEDRCGWVQRNVCDWIAENGLFAKKIGCYIFTHARLPKTAASSWTNATAEEWNDAIWGVSLPALFGGESTVPDATVVVGHFTASAFHAFEQRPEPLETYDISHYNLAAFGRNANFGIYRQADFIAIDACTAYSKRCNVLVINDIDKGPFDPVNYPCEDPVIQRGN